MKFSLLAVMSAGLLALANCSNDGIVDNRILRENDVLTSIAPNENEINNNDVMTISYIGLVFNYNGTSSGVYNKIAVAVSVNYQYYQPVPPGIEVFLEVIPDSLAIINDTVYTTIWGWAFAKLMYPAIYAFEEVLVVASCGSIADTVLLNLPICPGSLELNADSQRLFVENPGEYDTTSITCQLINRAGIPQRNGRVSFIALIAGQICGPTTAYTDDRGYCHTQYRIRYEDIPNSNSDPNYIETMVRASLFGYPDMEGEIRLFCTRP